MSLSPDITEIIARARADLRMGVPVVLRGGGSAALVMAAETLDGQRLADLRALGDAGSGDHRAPRRHAQGARL